MQRVNKGQAYLATPLSPPNLDVTEAGRRTPSLILTALATATPLALSAPHSCGQAAAAPAAKSTSARSFLRLGDLIKALAKVAGFIAALLVSAALVTLLLWIQRVAYPDRLHLALFTVATERRRGRKSFRKMKRQLNDRILPPNHPRSRRVKSLLNQILAVIEEVVAPPESSEEMDNDYCSWPFYQRDYIKHLLDGLRWEVIVVDDRDQISAECFTGGKIIVYTGLLDFCKSTSELALIICHEVGHIVARHTAEKKTRRAWARVFMLCCGCWDADSSDELENLYMLPLSRRFEMEADYFGLLLSASAGFDPRIAPEVLLREARVNPWLDDDDSTHPPSEKRAQFLSQSKVMVEARKRFEKFKQKQLSCQRKTEFKYFS